MIFYPLKYTKRFLIIGFFASLIGACNLPLPPLSEEGKDPLPVQNVDVAEAKELAVFNGKAAQGPSSPPSKIKHLSVCESDTDCGSGLPGTRTRQVCRNIFGTPTCFFPCDPDKGTEDIQNPGCLEPENCIRLSNGAGACVYLPGQLYGSGSYGALVRHQVEENCLLRFGGCQPKTLCVDTKQHGSIGTCMEECIPPLSGQTAPVCKFDSNATCTRLASGFGACIQTN